MAGWRIRSRIRSRLMIGRGIRLDNWALDRILERWVEAADGRGAPHRRLDGEPWADRAGYVEPSELLWICTVGCKLQKCPARPMDPDDPRSAWMPVVEQVVRLNADIPYHHNKLEGIRSAIERLTPPPRKKVAKSILELLAQLKGDERKLNAELEWAEGRVEHLAGTDDYRDGRTYLAWAFAEATLEDPDFLAWSLYACWLVSPAFLLKPAMERLGLTLTQLAERLGASYETASRWFASRNSRRWVRIPIHYAPALRELLTA